MLPFNNMSGDPEQEYFSDGITEDIITDLSQDLRPVRGRPQHRLHLQGQAPQLQQVAAELGVSYLLEGSVRKAGQRVRITGQLIDGANGGHVWADRYDRDLTDIFAIQDEITQAIVEQLKVRLLPEEKKAIGRRRPRMSRPTLITSGAGSSSTTRPNHLCCWRGEMFARAVELDPQLCPRLCRHRRLRFAALGLVRRRDSGRRASWRSPTRRWRSIPTWPKPMRPAATRWSIATAGRKRLPLSSGRLSSTRTASTPTLLCALLRHRGEFERAVELFMRALEIQPDDYQSPMLLQIVSSRWAARGIRRNMARLGIKRAEEALSCIRKTPSPAQLGACALAHSAKASGPKNGSSACPADRSG